MRTIKFRVWVETVDGLKSMIYPKLVSFGSSGSLSWVTTTEDELIKDNGYCKERVPMQFTGLLDKNGKEIYEGDTIWYGLNLTGDKYMGCVVFDEGGFNLKSPLAPELLPLYGADMIEVIGNIYENPGLLKS